jgi:hypothetical protein
VQITTAPGKDVLLVDRFDREPKQGGWSRKAVVSALTVFELDEMLARHASYETLAEIIRRRFQNPKEGLGNYSEGLPSISCVGTPMITHGTMLRSGTERICISPLPTTCALNFAP